MAKKNKKISKNEFRYNYNLKHTNFIFEEDNYNYHSLGLTTRKRTFGKENLLLNTNPKHNDHRKSYVRNGIITDKKKNFSGIDKRFSFSDKDKPIIKSKIRNYKNYRRKKQTSFN